MARALLGKVSSRDYSKLVSESAKGLGPAVKAPPGTFGLAVIFIGVAPSKGSKYSTYLDIVVTADVASRVQHIPTATTVDGKTLPVIAVHKNGTIQVLLGREKFEDPSGAKNQNGTPKKLARFIELKEPYTIHPQQRIRVWVDGKLEDALKMKPKEIILGGAYVEPYSYKDKKTGEEKHGVSLKASGVLDTEGQVHFGQLPLIPRLRHLFPYETQNVPTIEELRAATHVGGGGGGDDEEDVEVAGGSGVIRLEVTTFPGHPGVLSSEDDALATALNHGMAVAAVEVPMLVVPGAKIVENNVEKGQRRPHIGGSVLLHVTRVDDAKALDVRIGELSTQTDEERTTALHNEGLLKDLAMEIPLYPDSLSNMPGWFVPLTKAIVSGTKNRPPVPFTMLAMLNRTKSLSEVRQRDVFPHGILTASVRGLGLIYDIRRYLESYGLRVSHRFVHDGRFSRGANLGQMVDTSASDSVVLWMTDAYEGKAMPQTLVRYDCIDRLENPDGVVLLDVLTEGHTQLSEMAEGQAVKYYAVPLYDAPPDTGLLMIVAGVNPTSGDEYVARELVRLGRMQEGDDFYASLKKPSTMLQPPVEWEGKHKSILPYFATFAVLAARTPPGADPYAPPVQPSQQRTTKDVAKRALDEETKKEKIVDDEPATKKQRIDG